MATWIWETTPVHLSFDSERYFGEIVEPISGEVWMFNLSRHAQVTVGSPEEQDAIRIPLRPNLTEAEELEDGIRITLDHDGVRCVFELTLDPESSEILCVVREVPVTSRRVLSAVFPGPLIPKRQRRHEVLDTRRQGRLHRPVVDTERRIEISGASVPMPWWAELGEKSAVLAIVETPFDWKWSYTDTLAGTTATCRWISSLGALNTTRRLRYVFLPGRGYLQPARRYRRYAKETGLHIPMAPRCAENPRLNRLLGACAIFLGHIDDPGCDYVRNLETLKEAGIDRAFVYPLTLCSHNEEYLLAGSPPIERAYIAPDVEDNLEFIAAPGMWVENLWERSPNIRPEMLLAGPGGSPEVEIQLEEERFLRLHEGYAAQMLRDLEEEYIDFMGAHFETTASYEIRERLSSPWPYSRSDDARLRSDLMRLLCDRGMVVSTGEHRDWALAVSHLAGDMVGVELGVHSPMWPVPLWRLVYHDASFSTWPDSRNCDNSHDSSGATRRRFLLDMLYANIPFLQPMGSHYRFTTPPHVEVYSRSLGDPEVRESLPLAVRAARHHRRHGLEDLIYHAILTEDSSVQESAFESGTHVIVNFGTEPYTLPGGQVIEAESVLVD